MRAKRPDRSSPLPRQLAGDDRAWLKRRKRAPGPDRDGVRTVDLFAGCGGISLGLREGFVAAGMGFTSVAAVEIDDDARATYVANFRPEHALGQPVETLFDGAPGARLTTTEKTTRDSFGHVDLLVGGPPCQGHSDLNNSTRRHDPRNDLYFRMARAARVLEPRAVFVENVVGARHDRGGVVQRTSDALEQMGYHVSTTIMDAHQLGVPQRRRRLVLVATRGKTPTLDEVTKAMAFPDRDVRFAIEDLVDAPRDDLMDRVAASHETTRKRIDYLFDHDLYELPDTERPPCHRDKAHSYSSIYGRLRWNRPAQTITRGFYSMCMGRYVHPSRRRTLTAREAARLQFFPDFFDFSPIRTRSTLARVIGNAVPPRLGYVAAGAMLGAMS